MPRPLEEILSDLYLSNIDIIGEGIPAWVNALRSRALENFNLLSLPSAKDADCSTGSGRPISYPLE